SRRAIPRQVRVFYKVRGRISKACGRKIQIVRKEIQSQGKRNPSFFLPRIGTIQELTGESLRLAPRRPALARVDVRRCACFVRTVPQSMPASLRPRSRPFGELGSAIA